ncbi:[acyl-carrier-protein] S-malonyltransferase [Candidatus Aerophobetes bacterium]|uniref:Malonyl CoA-acyl carrier protein transacylase n=1 Tax=Aerophobetes bacterium TaxID=2030807 RepID=A0A2A4X6G5_UNCAE|nr:MAG: [acyl-carrier-protein] S-malonyltransferase [Candidatus Aerophobetes bacterium]
MKELKIACLFPGQGSQYVGMGKSFFEESERSRAVFNKADKLLGFSLSEIIFRGPSEKLTLTKYSQLALYVTSIAIWKEICFAYPQFKPFVCAGLSLGEYSALVCAGKLSFEEGLLLVQNRANFMHDASCENKGSMRVVLGLSLEAVQSEVQEIHSVWVANINCPNQVVISGSIAGLEAASIVLKEKGARRILGLDVSGAFHSGLMQTAKEKLAPFIRQANFTNQSQTRIVMNITGNFETECEQVRANLIDQVTGSVYWQKGIEAMDSEGVDLYVEIGKKTLSRMNTQIGVKGSSMHIESMQDLPKLKQIFEEKLV